jgi:5'-nucleotidase
MYKKQILYYDMDGVIVDMEAHVNSQLGGRLIGISPDDAGRVVDSYFNLNPMAIINLNPISGAIDAVKENMQMFDVYFLSTPIYAVPNSYSGKRIWLQNHFGDLAKKKLILTHRKDLAIGDFLVDDRLKHGANYFQGELLRFGSEQWPNHAVINTYLREKHLNHKKSWFNRENSEKHNL